MKKTNNQGFSLVELIIVIAIMAVLVGVLAPQFIKYVEKSRYQKDVSSVEELRNAVEVALSEEAVYNEVSTITSATPFTLTIGIDSAAALTYPANTTSLQAAVASSINSLSFSSKLFKNAAAGAIKVVITYSSTTSSFTVTATHP